MFRETQVWSIKDASIREAIISEKERVLSSIREKGLTVRGSSWISATDFKDLSEQKGNNR